MVPKLFPWSSRNSRISFVRFRTFKGSLFPKPVTGQELFLAISYSKPALELKSFESFNATPLLLSSWMKETEIRQNKINLDEMQIISSIQRTMKDSKWLSTMVVYICSSLVHLTVGSRDLFQTEKNITVAYKRSKFTKWQLFSLKMVKVVILNEK